MSTDGRTDILTNEILSKFWKHRVKWIQSDICLLDIHLPMLGTGPGSQSSANVLVDMEKLKNTRKNFMILSKCIYD